VFIGVALVDVVQVPIVEIVRMAVVFYGGVATIRPWTCECSSCLVHVAVIALYLRGI
jgi:uncharacterized protein (UPF0179 family)